jgi:UDP-glucuronate 4-epimerase
MASKKPRGLGRGLEPCSASASGGAIAEAPAAGERLRSLPIEQLQPGKYQPRSHMDPERLTELAESIKAQGVIQPIVVRAGRTRPLRDHRRRTALACRAAGRPEARCRSWCAKCDDQAAIAMALIENIQREDLNPLEEALALQPADRRIRHHAPAGRRSGRPLARGGQQPAAPARPARFERVIHLAAQAGVRYSLQHPEAYAHSNLDGFLAMLEACRHRKVQHLVYASSSSVYGAGAMPPFREDARVDQPLSFYAATKAANELMAYTYAHLYGLHATGLRFFTVYGPWGRPDMAPVLFSRAVLAGREIEVFNHGRMRRDFTQVEDIVAGVLGALATPSSATPPHRVFNLGNHTPENLEDCIRIIETAAGKPALKRYRDMQPGDMPETMADTTAARAAFGFEPRIRIQDGLPPVVAWCRDYFGARA